MFARLKQILHKTPRDTATPGQSAIAPQQPAAEAPPVSEAEQAPVLDCTLLDARLSGWFLEETDELLAGFQVQAEHDVLDVGCGDGTFVRFCANRGAAVTFVDIDPDKISEAEQQLQGSKARSIQGLVSNANPLPLADNQFDRIVGMEVMEHVDDPAAFLAELVRVGKPGALYLLSVPDCVSEGVQQQVAPAVYFQKPNHINIFSREEFARLVSDAGLIIEKRTSYGFYWSVFWAFFWTCDQDLKDPWHPLLQSWTRTWEILLQMRDGPRIKQALDQVMPKSQAIIARKPQ